MSVAWILDNLFAFVGVLSLDGTLLQANRAPIEAGGLDPADVLDRPFWECWWWSYSTDAQAALKQSIARCAGGETLRYDADVRMAGGRMMRIDFMLAPSRDESGRVTRLIASGVDVSPRHQVETRLRASEGRLRMALSAAGAAGWDWNIDTDEIHWSEEHWDLYGIARDAPPSYKAWLGAVLPEDRHIAEGRIRAVLDGDTDSFEAEYRIRHPQRGLRWMLGLGRGERDSAGRVHRLSGIAIDSTERKQAEQDLRLLMAEVDHRAKNMLAVVQAMLRLTRADDIDAYRTAIEGRVAALARTHTQLAEQRWRGVDLTRLLEGELRPAAAGPGRVTLSGPRVLLAADAAQAVAMSVHELTANARQHGALSDPKGRLDISWTLDDQGGLSLRWVEHDGPAVKPPPEMTGFGTIVIDRSIGQQLGGEIHRDWGASGLSCTIHLPPVTLVESTRSTVVARKVAPVPIRRSVPRRRLLIVEDTPLVAMELEQVLAEAGYEVVGPAMSLEKGLSLAERETVDAAVLDVNLAGRFVFPLAEKLRAGNVPILFCTGYDMSILSHQGFSDYPFISKPFAAATLRAAVRDLFPAE